MKTLKPLFILATAALLVSCGQNTPASTDASSAASGTTTSDVTSATTSEATSEVSEQSQQTSAPATTSKEQETTSQDGGTSQGEDESTSIDISGVVEEASAENGDKLTDWTDDMKVILKKHLNNYLPPYYPMANLKVTYDELGYLTVTGTAKNGALEEYGATMYQGGWDGYIGADEAGRDHCYARKLESDGILESDALVANGIMSILYDFYPSQTDWPAGYVEMAMEEYGSVAEVPVFPASSYIAQISYMYDVNIFCLGTKATDLATYAKALENERWTVTSETIEGTKVYTAVSLDALAILTFYFDGTGVQLNLTHGEGENYTTWADCLTAIDDFATHDLRLDAGISSSIPEIPEALQYSIDRSIRGRLTVTALKNTSFKASDIASYRQACANAGYIIDENKSTDETYVVWAYPEDKSYALTFELGTYYSDLGDATSTFVITVQDYRIYEGYYVFNEWPENVVATIVNRVASGTTVPGYLKDDATYYAKSNYSDEVIVDVVNPGEGAVATYKAGLEEYGFKVSEDNGGYLAVNKAKTLQVSFSLINEELHIVIRRYVAPIIVDGDECELAFNQNTISNNEKGWWQNVTFGGSPFSVLVEQNTSSYSVGNSGDYIEPLRLYKNQKVTIAPETDKVITKIQFAVVDAKNAKGLVSGFDKENVKNLSIEGATFESYNTNTNVATYTVSADYQATGVSFVISGQFAVASIIATIA